MTGLTIAALSQVSLVSGFGSSCSQPLLAKLPSHTVGSGRKDEFHPRAAAGGSAAAAQAGPCPPPLLPTPAPVGYRPRGRGGVRDHARNQRLVPGALQGGGPHRRRLEEERTALPRRGRM